MNTSPTPIQSIGADRLCGLSGLTDRRHRQFAAQGFFPPPVAGEYQLNATIAGLFKYFRTASEKQDALRAAQTRKERALAAKLERQNKLAEGTILEWEVVELYLHQRVFGPMQGAFDSCPDREWLEKVLKPIVMQKLNPPPPPKSPV